MESLTLINLSKEVAFIFMLGWIIVSIIGKINFDVFTDSIYYICFFYTWIFLDRVSTIRSLEIKKEVIFLTNAKSTATNHSGASILYPDWLMLPHMRMSGVAFLP